MAFKRNWLVLTTIAAIATLSYLPAMAKAQQDTAAFHNDSHRFYLKARKLFEQKKYKTALRNIDLSLANLPPITLDQEVDLHLSICLKLAGAANKSESKHYYELVLADCDKGLKGWNALEYYLPKVEALIGLGRKEEAILCCQTGYNYALGAGDSTEKFSAYLVKLGAASQPPPELTSKNILQIQNEMSDMVKLDVCPTQNDIEKIIGAPFEVSSPDEPNLIRRNIVGGNSLYRHVELRIPHKIEGPSSLTFDIRPEAGAISEEMVRLVRPESTDARTFPPDGGADL